MKSSHPVSSIYGYKPSVAAAVIGAILLVSATILTIFLYFKHRSWFLYMVVLGALMEATGFVARAHSAIHLTEVYPFLVSYFTIMYESTFSQFRKRAKDISLAPSLLAAACYMTFGRIVWYITPSDRRTFSTLWIPVRWITPFFVGFDLFAFLIQLGGIGNVGSAYTSNKSPKDKAATLDHGLRVLKFGLITQLFCFAIFAVIGLRFVLVSRKWFSHSAAVEWKKCAWMVNGAAALITLRAIYRVFETSESISLWSGSKSNSGSQVRPASYLLTHEWPFWICDALPILAVLILFSLVHPGACLPSAFTRFRLDKKQLVNTSKAQGQETSPSAYNYAMT